MPEPQLVARPDSEPEALGAASVAVAVSTAGASSIGSGATTVSTSGACSTGATVTGTSSLATGSTGFSSGAGVVTLLRITVVPTLRSLTGFAVPPPEEVEAEVGFE